MSGAIDWTNDEHRRCIAACLVKATYVTEKHIARAWPWFESFGFKADSFFFTDSSVNDGNVCYGGVFKMMEPAASGAGAGAGPSAPKYVVAFRGTMPLHPNMLPDLLQNTLLLFNVQKEYARFKDSHSHVDNLIRELSSGSVWLAGHSLGASLALEIGRTVMLEQGVNIPTFLFNPPHVSPASVIHRLLSEEHKTRLYTAIYGFKFLLANVVPWHRKGTRRLFAQLAPWEPEIYVNPDDTICRGYMDYFVQRQLISEKHPRIGSTGARTSCRDILFFTELRPHLLPSASLWVNLVDKEDPHGLRQWWKSDENLALTNTRFLYDPPLN